MKYNYNYTINDSKGGKIKSGECTDNSEDEAREILDYHCDKQVLGIRRDIQEANCSCYHCETDSGDYTVTIIKAKAKMVYLIAIIVCGIELVAYLLMGILLFGWKKGGGIIPMMVLFGIMGMTWRAITKQKNKEELGK